MQNEKKFIEVNQKHEAPRTKASARAKWGTSFWSQTCNFSCVNTDLDFIWGTLIFFFVLTVLTMLLYAVHNRIHRACFS